MPTLRFDGLEPGPPEACIGDQDGGAAGNADSPRAAGQLARHIKPSQVAPSKRGHKVKKTREWIDGTRACAHVSTARTIKACKKQKPLKGLVVNTIVTNLCVFDVCRDALSLIRGAAEFGKNRTLSDK
ncbi:hypothetical protein [Azotobacter beijerinckii]|uniref:hypothetical protein n=1 Tax=Azotobacter beijerinckii TaxID=170623 RepID=UPI003CC7ADCC